MTKNIKRQPIQLTPHDVAIIHIFNRYDHLEDLWTSDVIKYEEEKFEIYDNAAKQFMSQLEGKTTIRFLQCLRKEIDDIINEWEKSIKEH